MPLLFGIIERTDQDIHGIANELRCIGTKRLPLKFKGYMGEARQAVFEIKSGVGILQIIKLLLSERPNCNVKMDVNAMNGGGGLTQSTNVT
ncbi:hypothetical protein QYF36_002790 [Acer negundo]|nr:hypothetical protein QYF36_002790 [Acer negundo]